MSSARSEPSPLVLPSLTAIDAEIARREAEERRGDAAQAARESLAEFIKQGWHVIEPGTPLDWNWHLDFLCVHYEALVRGEFHELLVNIGPGYMKSLVQNVFMPAWVWTWWPGWRAIFASYDRALSIRDSLKRRDLIRSDWYQETFRPSWVIRKDQDSKLLFANTETGFLEVTSVGGGGTGKRAHAVLCDDPHNVKAKPTDEEFETARHWWLSRMGNRFVDMSRPTKAIIMQRVDERDLSAAVKRLGGYVHLCLPSEFDPDRQCETPLGKDPRTKRGELLFPKRFGAEVLQGEKDRLGPEGYSAQHDQSPTPRGGGIVRVEHISHYYRRRQAPPAVSVRNRENQLVQRRQRKLPDSFDMILGAWDLRMSRSQLPSSSWAVGQVWGIVRPRLYLLDRRRGRWGLGESIEALLELQELYDFNGHLIEDKAYGDGIVEQLEDEVPGLILVPPKGSKEQRLEGAEPWFRGGDVYSCHPDDDADGWHAAEWEPEIIRFGKYPSDDHADCTTLIINYARTELWGGQSATEALGRM